MSYDQQPTDAQKQIAELERENAKLRADKKSLHRKYNIGFLALTKLVRSPADAPEIAQQAVQECIDVE